MASKATSTPAPLPPSVEREYRQKCIELRRRMVEVEESNDVYRLRKVRLNRGIMKLRLERAFLLEQLAMRTSRNVEDSEGSPSPPPTPKEKPLRSKRGHRRPEAANNSAGDGAPASPTNSNSVPPNTENNGHADNPPPSSPPPPRRSRPTQSSGSRRSTPRRPNSAYEMFARDTRPELIRDNPEAKSNEDELNRLVAQSWHDMGYEGQDHWAALYEEEKERRKISEGRGRATRRTTDDGRLKVNGKKGHEGSGDPGREEDESAADEEGEAGAGVDADIVMREDVQMGGVDGGGDARADGDGVNPKGAEGDGDEDGEGGGFTAVNR
ncbi:MAG: hypothetical protein M4579_000023 [Chaenotheca gracillima]|nr:MAG: hypothetical protein M4579_000023 [Chaenotheca gracillima]